MLFNILSRFIISFLPRSKYLLISSFIICSDFGAQENTICHWFHFFSFYLPGVLGPDAMILDFSILSFNPAFSLSSFNLIKRLFNSSSLSVIRVVSFAYLRLLIFVLPILIPASILHYVLCMCVCVCVCVLVTQSCPTLCDLMECSLPSSSVHGILQARILEGFPCSSTGIFPKQGSNLVSHIAGRFFTIRATREALNVFGLSQHHECVLSHVRLFVTL